MKVYRAGRVIFLKIFVAGFNSNRILNIYYNDYIVVAEVKYKKLNC
jgi:hypothetical protein